MNYYKEKNHFEHKKVSIDSNRKKSNSSNIYDNFD